MIDNPPKNQETDKIGQRMARHCNQCQPGKTDEHNGNNERPFHLLLGNDPFLHAA